MAAAQVLKQQLLAEIDKLPEDRLGQVLDFVEFLATRKREPGTATVAAPQSAAHEADPMLAFIGNSDEEPVSGKLTPLDKELYDR